MKQGDRQEKSHLSPCHLVTLSPLSPPHLVTVSSLQRRPNFQESGPIARIIGLARVGGRQHAREHLRCRRRHRAMRPVRRPWPGGPAFLVIAPIGRLTWIADWLGTAVLKTN